MYEVIGGFLVALATMEMLFGEEVRGLWVRTRIHKKMVTFFLRLIDGKKGGGQ